MVMQNERKVSDVLTDTLDTLLDRYSVPRDFQSTFEIEAEHKRAVRDAFIARASQPRRAPQPVRVAAPVAKPEPTYIPAPKPLSRLLLLLPTITLLITFAGIVSLYLKHQKQAELQALNRAAVIDASIQNDETGGTTEEASTRDPLAQYREKYPNIDFPAGMSPAFADLYAKNTDLIGWLKIPGLDIDAPVYQHKQDIGSDSDYYLRYNSAGERSRYGEYFLDKDNAGTELDPNNIIYGHNMIDGMMFHALEEYYTAEGCAKAPVIQYSTLYNTYRFKIFAVIITNGYPEGDNGYLFDYTTRVFPSEEAHKDFLVALMERSIYFTGTDVGADDTLITLSTCSYKIRKTDMGRLAIVARQLRDGEAQAINVNDIVYNEAPRYPQVWYNEHNMSNPYFDAYKWRVENYIIAP